MVEYEVRGHVALLTLNRPEARNAVNDVVAQTMTENLEKAEADDDVWVMVLAATGTVFCAGADLKMVNSGRAGELATPKGGFGGFTDFPRRKPVIAAVDGLATAGGCEIALACDMIVASTNAAFGLAEVKRNLVAAGGGLYRLPKVIGKNVALEVALTGEPLSPERAYELGLVNKVTPSRARPSTRPSCWPRRSPPTPRSPCGRAASSCSPPTGTTRPRSRRTPARPS
jgi:enoyl-CoA hydratase